MRQQFNRNISVAAGPYINVDDRLVDAIDSDKLGVDTAGVEGHEGAGVAGVRAGVPCVVPCRIHVACATKVSVV